MSSTDGPDAAALFEAANKLRGSVESAEYKHLVLGLIFLKYISDSFEFRREQLAAELSDPASGIEDETQRLAVLEDRDEYVSENVFWVPEQARWMELLAAASQPDIGKRLDDALELVEQENPGLRNILPRIYARAQLSAELLGSLVETIAKIGFGKGAEEARDILGRIYEYFIKEFARAEGHRGGEFFTPAPVARLLVEMLEPYEGRVLDPACGSCGLFVQSAKFVRAHGGRPEKISIYGQERNQATWRIGQMNLAIHGLSGEVKYTEGGSLLDDAFPSLKADFVMANPPFNQSEWSTPAVLEDARWAHGVPPAGNANYAWIQHFLHHLAPQRSGWLRDGERVAHDDDGWRGRHPREPRTRRRSRLHRRAAGPALLHDRHPGLPVVPRSRQGIIGRARPPGRAPVHRRSADGSQDQSHADRADG
jgi:type I restriction enzyme M protein